MRDMRGDFRFLLAGLLLSAAMAGCTRSHFLDYPDVMLPIPAEAELAARVKRAEGPESWRKDPRRVADRAIRSELRPSWQYRPYREEDYTFVPDHPDWGPHVLRGNVTGSVHRRYRVKMRPWRGIWYATVVSHYDEVVLDHPAMAE